MHVRFALGAVKLTPSNVKKATTCVKIALDTAKLTPSSATIATTCAKNAPGTVRMTPSDVKNDLTAVWIAPGTVRMTPCLDHPGYHGGNPGGRATVVTLGQWSELLHLPCDMKNAASA